MKILFFFYLLTFSIIATAQNAKPIKRQELENYLQQPHDTVYVLNFWATWCAPCVRELPHFEELNNKLANSPVRILLISLDFAKDYDTKLLPFLKRRNIRNEVLWLNEPDGNTWIDRVWKDWQGEIPATLIYRPNRFQRFIPQEISLDELEKNVQEALAK